MHFERRLVIDENLAHTKQKTPSLVKQGLVVFVLFNLAFQATVLLKLFPSQRSVTKTSVLWNKSFQFETVNFTDQLLNAGSNIPRFSLLATKRKFAGK